MLISITTWPGSPQFLMSVLHYRLNIIISKLMSRTHSKNEKDAGRPFICNKKKYLSPCC